MVETQLRFPIEWRIEQGDSLEDIQRLCRALDRGDLHLGVLWGLEFGWVQPEFTHLRCLAVANPQGDLSIRVQLIVRKDDAAARVDDLQGRTLVQYERMPRWENAFLLKLLQGKRLDNFFGEIRSEPSVGEAATAVNEGSADCMTMRFDNLGQLRRSKPNYDLKAIETSLPLPGAIVIGRPEIVDSLRPNLWTDARQVLVKLSRTPGGPDRLEFWRVEGFSVVDGDMQKLILERAREYPPTLLNLTE